MKPRADYERIAAHYDADRARFAQSAHPSLPASGLVLDVGCGTGAWLAAQVPGPTLVGVDPSPGMLRHATVPVVCGRAEALPFPDSAVRWVESCFAHHHFDERAFLAEAARVLEPGGMLELVNVIPHLDPGFLLHRLFPETFEVDVSRFAGPDQLEEWIADAGFTGLQVELFGHRSTVTAATALATLRPRVASQLDLIDDAAFERGISLLGRVDPETELVDDYRVWTFRARLSPLR